MNKSTEHTIIHEKLVHLLSSFSKIPPSQITDLTSLKEELGIDSVDALDLMFVLEKKFEVFLSDKEIANVKSVGDLKNVISKKMQVCQDSTTKT